MVIYLVAVANATGQDAVLTSTEHPRTDNWATPALQTTHTGGAGGDKIRLPDCSDSTYWPGHHITIAATSTDGGHPTVHCRKWD